MWTYVAFSTYFFFLADKENSDRSYWKGRKNIVQAWTWISHISSTAQCQKHINLCITSACKCLKNKSQNSWHCFTLYCSLSPFFLPIPSFILAVGLSSLQRWSNPLIHYLQQLKALHRTNTHTIADTYKCNKSRPHCFFDIIIYQFYYNDLSCSPLLH